MPDSDADEQHNQRLLAGLLWAGVGLAPVAVLLVLLGDGGGSLRFAMVLLAVAVVLIGASLLIRSDPVLSRMDLRDRVAEEIDALRAELQEEIAAARPVRPMTPPPMPAMTPPPMPAMTPPPMPAMTPPPMPAPPVASAAVPSASAAVPGTPSGPPAGPAVPRRAGTAQVPRPTASAQVPRPPAAAAGGRPAASAQVPRPGVPVAGQQRPAPGARAAAAVRPPDEVAPPAAHYPATPPADEQSPERPRRRRRAGRAAPQPDDDALDASPSAWLAEPDDRWVEPAYGEQPARRHRADDEPDAYPPQGHYAAAEPDLYDPDAYADEPDLYPAAEPDLYVTGEHDGYGTGQPEHYDDVVPPAPETRAARRARQGAAGQPAYPEADEYGRW